MLKKWYAVLGLNMHHAERAHGGTEVLAPRILTLAPDNVESKCHNIKLKYDSEA